MTDDERCCGTGTCIINAEGVCWCGQKWDGQKMCFPSQDVPGGQKDRALDSPEEGKTLGTQGSLGR